MGVGCPGAIFGAHYLVEFAAGLAKSAPSRNFAGLGVAGADSAPVVDGGGLDSRDI